MKRLGLPLATLHSQNLVDSVKKKKRLVPIIYYHLRQPSHLNLIVLFFCIIANVRIVDSQVFWVTKKRKEILSLVSEGGVISHVNI